MYVDVDCGTLTVDEFFGPEFVGIIGCSVDGSVNPGGSVNAAVTVKNNHDSTTASATVEFEYDGRRETESVSNIFAGGTRLVSAALSFPEHSYSGGERIPVSANIRSVNSAAVPESDEDEYR